MPLPDPWNLPDFIAALERKRRRTIRLTHYPAHADIDHPCGLWLQCGEAVVYEQSTSQYHCQEIILHEIGHIMAAARPRDLRPG